METRPLMEEMLIMLPPPARRMAGITAFVPRNTPLALISMMLSQSSPVVSSMSLRSTMAALFTRTSTLPNRSSAVSTARCQSSGAGDVQAQVDGLSAQLAYLRLHLHPQLIPNVSDDHLRPLLGEHPRLGGALPPRAAGNDRTLPSNLMV